jgi:hypothetical protein
VTLTTALSGLYNAWNTKRIPPQPPLRLPQTPVTRCWQLTVITGQLA